VLPWCPTVPYASHLASSISQPESWENPEVNTILEISIIYSWQCLTCWPTMAPSLSAASSDIVCLYEQHCVIHSHTFMSLHKNCLMEWSKLRTGKNPSLAHQTEDNGDKRQHKTWSFYTLSKRNDHKVGESADSVNTGIQPCTKYSLYDSDSQRSYDQTIRGSCGSKSSSWLMRAIFHVIN